MARAAGSVHDEHEARMAELYNLRPSEATACPRVVAGLRCRAWRLDRTCPCYRHRHLLDHGRIWLDDAGRHVLTGEPYEAWGEELAAFIADLAALGLSVMLSGSSPWNPGATLLIIIRREGENAATNGLRRARW